MVKNKHEYVVTYFMQPMHSDQIEDQVHHTVLIENCSHDIEAIEKFINWYSDNCDSSLCSLQDYTIIPLSDLRKLAV